MSELLLQTIVEKLEALEIALLKENKVGKDQANGHELIKEVKSLQSEMIKLPSLFKVSNEKTNKMLESITTLNSRLNNPSQNNFNHSHHLHKGVWVAVGLFITSLFFLYEWISTSNEKEKFEANDIKYRYLKANGNSHLTKFLYHADSLYNLEKENFTKLVVRKEQNIAKQAQLLQLAGEKENEVKELKKKLRDLDYN